jgi:protein-S-isoprenylcysteine O-methyltransferase Ste14
MEKGPMWIVRFSLLATLAALVAGFACFLRRHEKILENRTVNVFIVIVYNLLCYLIVVLPPASDGTPPATFMQGTSVRYGFPVIGSVLIISGVALAVVTARKRRAVGAQGVKAGLLTSGTYRYFRHPIYTGIVWVSLGLALITRNPDGLLMFPSVLGINIVEAVVEEKYDVGIRFREEYEAYKKTTKMFGPMWLWGVLVVPALVLIGIGIIVK